MQVALRTNCRAAEMTKRPDPRGWLNAESQLLGRAIPGRYQYRSRGAGHLAFSCLAPGGASCNLFSILLVVEDDIEEGAVHVDATIVVQEAQLPELIHEETHP